MHLLRTVLTVALSFMMVGLAGPAVFGGLVVSLGAALLMHATWS